MPRGLCPLPRRLSRTASELAFRSPSDPREAHLATNRVAKCAQVEVRRPPLARSHPSRQVESEARAKRA